MSRDAIFRRPFAVARLAAAVALVSLACSNVTVSLGGSATATAEPPTAAPAPTLPPPTEPPTAAPPPTEAAEPTAEAPATDTPPFFGQLEITPGLGFVDSLGRYVAVGEMVNLTDTWYDFIKVDVSFFDASGNSLATETEYVTPLPLAPGERGVFKAVTEAGGSVDAVASFTFVVSEAVENSDERYQGVELTGVEASSNSLTTGGEAYIITGSAANNGDTDCASAYVTAGFYDAEGKLGDVSVSSIDTEPLPVGASGAFRIYTPDLAAPYDHYQLWTECYT